MLSEHGWAGAPDKEPPGPLQTCAVASWVVLVRFSDFNLHSDDGFILALQMQGVNARYRLLALTATPGCEYLNQSTQVLLFLIVKEKQEFLLLQGACSVSCKYVGLGRLLQSDLD